MATRSLSAQVEWASFPQGRELLRSVMENAPIGMRLSHQDGRTAFVNQALADMFRMTRSELAGLSVRDMVVPEMVDEAEAQLAQVIDGSIEGYRSERLFVRSDGTRFWGLVSVSAVRSEVGGGLPQVISQIIDIDANKRAEAALAEAEQRWSFALESAGQGVWDHDLRAGTTFVSRTWKVMRGLDPDAPVDTSEPAWLARVHPDDRAFAANQEHLMARGESVQHEYEYRERHADGHMMWILSRGRAVAWNEDGSAARVIGTDTDVTIIKTAQSHLADVIATMSEAVVLFDMSERLVFRNEQYLRLFPATAHIRVPGARLEDILRASVAARETVNAAGADPGAYIESTRAALRAGGEWELQLTDGRWLEIRARPVADDGGYLSVLSDITRRKRAELDQADANRRLAALAHLDGLTGLINRRAFDELIETEFQRSIREMRPLSLLIIDVDYFKPYNDAYGHLAGDDCLKAIAGILQTALRRPGDRAARIGGEEFAVILPDTDAVGATIVAWSIRKAVRDLALRHDRSREGLITVSIGVADVARGDAPSGVRKLVARADEALYAAKAAGRDKVVGWSTETKTAGGVPPAVEDGWGDGI